MCNPPWLSQIEAAPDCTGDAQGRAITVILQTVRNFCACRAGVTPELTGSYHAPVGSASEFHVVAGGCAIATLPLQDFELLIEEMFAGPHAC